MQGDRQVSVLCLSPDPLSLTSKGCCLKQIWGVNFLYLCITGFLFMKPGLGLTLIIFIFILETGSHYVAQASLEPIISFLCAGII